MISPREVLKFTVLGAIAAPQELQIQNNDWISGKGPGAIATSAISSTICGLFDLTDRCHQVPLTSLLQDPSWKLA